LQELLTEVVAVVLALQMILLVHQVLQVVLA
jgi:hypothetical protein